MLTAVPVVTPPRLTHLMDVPGVGDPPVLPGVDPDVLLGSSRGRTVFRITVEGTGSELVVPVARITVHTTYGSLPPSPL